MKKEKINITKYILPAIIIILVLFFVLTSLVLRKTVLEKPKPSVPPEAASSWQNIKPGLTNEQELKQELGLPKKEYYEESKKVIEYQSEYKFSPHKIYLEKDTTALIKEQVPYDKNLKLSIYIAQYGQPPLTMYDKDLGNSRPLSIYPEQGMAIAAHEGDGSVLEIWHFTPMAQEQFEKTIGLTLSKTPTKKF
jgi:hypothetical protein